MHLLKRTLTIAHISTPARFAWLLGACAFALLTFLSLFVVIPSCKSSLNGALNERYTLMTQYLADSLSQGLSMGVSLKDMHTHPHLLESLRNQDNAINSISIFSHNDQSLLSQRSASILHSTETHLKNTPLPVHWLPYIFEDTPHHFSQNDSSSVCVNVFTPYGQPAGGVILTWSHAPFVRTLHTYYMVLFCFIVLSTAAAAICAYMLGLWLWRPVMQSFQTMQETLETALRHRCFAPFIAHTELERCFHAMYKRTKSLFDMLAMIESNIGSSSISDADPDASSTKPHEKSHEQQYRSVS